MPASAGVALRKAVVGKYGSSDPGAATGSAAREGSGLPRHSLGGGPESGGGGSPPLPPEDPALPPEDPALPPEDPALPPEAPALPPEVPALPPAPLAPPGVPFESESSEEPQLVTISAAQHSPRTADVLANATMPYRVHLIVVELKRRGYA